MFGEYQSNIEIMVELATTGGGDINAATDTDSEGGGDTAEGRQSQREETLPNTRLPTRLTSGTLGMAAVVLTLMGVGKLYGTHLHPALG